MTDQPQSKTMSDQLRFNDRVKRADAGKCSPAAPELPQNNDGTGYARFQMEEIYNFKLEVS